VSHLAVGASNIPSVRAAPVQTRLNFQNLCVATTTTTTNSNSSSSSNNNNNHNNNIPRANSRQFFKGVWCCQNGALEDHG